MSTNVERQPVQRRARPTGSRRALASGSPRPPERSERAAATAAEIVRAARGVFEQMGFGGTRMDDIAAAAGVSRPLLYHYFPNKRDLFVEVGRTSTIAFREVLAAVRAVPDRWQPADIERLAAVYLVYMDDHGSVLSTWSHATWNDTELRDLGVAAQLRNFTAIGEEMCRLRGSATIAPMQEGMAVLGMIERLWYYARVGGAPITGDELLATITQELVARLRRA